MAGLTHLLDSDVMVDAIRGRSSKLPARLARHEGSVAVSSVSVSELTYGAFRSSAPDLNLAALDQFLAFVVVLPFDADAAREAGRIRADLTKRGTPIGAYDLLISAQAYAAGLVLATGNVCEFKHVRGLTVENWR